MRRETGPWLLCLVTDRRRLAAAMKAEESTATALLLKQVEGAIQGGVDLVHIREGDLEAGALADLVRRCVHIARETRAAIVVNDRVDVALAAGAQGVHLREDSMAVAAVRRLADVPFIVGRSIHSEAGAAASRLADYLVAGSVFDTVSKPGGRASLGLDGLRAVVRAAGGCPVLAIGGMTAERLPVAIGSGARGMAAIGAFLPPAPTTDLVTAVQHLTSGLRFAFDRPTGVS